MLLLLALGCAPQLTIKKVQEYCTNVDFSNPGTSVVESAWEGDTASVWRTYAYEPAGVTFDADIEAEDKVLHIYEAWTESTSEDEQCYQPTVDIQGITRDLEVRWYLEGESVPMATVILEAP